MTMVAGLPVRLTPHTDGRHHAVRLVCRGCGAVSPLIALVPEADDLERAVEAADHWARTRGWRGGIWLCDPCKEIM